MRKILLLLAMTVFLGSSAALAQKKDNNFKRFERAEARKVEPEIRTFVTPQICDMQMLSKNRETYGPYTFPINSIDDTFNFEITNFQNRALYRACQEADADAVIEPLFNVAVYDKDSKTLVVELSGYTVRYVNFRPATKAEIEMIGVVYPQTRTSVSVGTGDTPKGPDAKTSK